MPSPFPGMDPHLEGSEWISVHAELSSELARELAPKLRPKYIVRTIRRFITEIFDDPTITTEDIYPDVSIIGSLPAQDLKTDAAVAAPVPVQIPTVMPVRVPQVSIEIRDVAQRDLIAAIKILSPANKRGEGYLDYVDERGRILLSRTHLIEIDLLRNGRRVPMQQPLPTAPYYVFLSRAGRRPLVDVWPIQLQNRLPLIPVPLLPSDDDVQLDLQQAFNAVYDGLGYDLSVDYTRPPDIPLDDDDARWAEQLLAR